MKKIISVLLMLCMALTCLVSAPITTFAATSGSCGENLTWTLDENGVLTVSGTGEMWDFMSTSDVPWDDYKHRDIKYIAIEDGVTSIGVQAFWACKGLISVDVSDSVVTIGRAAFNNCTNLQNIKMGSGVSEIGVSPFGGCNRLENINVSENNMHYCSINGNLFTKDKTTLIRYAEGKKEIDYLIPDGVTTIGDAAFSGSRLDNVEIPNSVVTIGVEIFEQCYSLKNINVAEDNMYYCSIDGNLFDKSKKKLIQYAVGKLDAEYAVPAGVTEICYCAFNGSSELVRIDIPSSVIVIDNAFRDCRNLMNINVDERNKEYYSVDGVLFNKNNAALLQYPIGKEDTEYNIPDDVKTIGEFAFADCATLTSVNISDSVERIEAGAFYYCEGLTNVELGKNVKTIGEDAFSDCYELTKIEIPDSVTTIDEYAFCLCSSLKTVVIGSGITNIDRAAFYYCKKIADVYYNGTEDEWKNNVIVGIRNEPLLNATFHFKNSNNFPAIQATVSANGKEFVVTPVNVSTGNIVILALYADGKLVDVQQGVYGGESLMFVTAFKYTDAKIMAWNGLDGLKPICAELKI